MQGDFLKLHVCIYSALISSFKKKKKLACSCTIRVSLLSSRPLAFRASSFQSLLCQNTRVTDCLFLARSLDVLGQIIFPVIALLAVRTLERLFPRVASLVCHELSLRPQPLPTLAAFWPRSRVDAFVLPADPVLPVAFPTVAALEGPLPCVDCAVILKAVL